METPIEKTNILNKSKKIDLKAGDNKIFKIDFINEIKNLRIEAKSINDMIPEIFSNEFTLEDIKKVKFFNDDYESIDECLSEIFDKLDKNETKLEFEKEELKIKVPLSSKKYPEITFLLKKKEKSDNVKYNELFDLVKKMKTEQEKEVKALKEKINYLEDLLKIKKEREKKAEDFDGSVVSIKCFDNNEFDNCFDNSNISNKEQVVFSFALSCKDEKDIHLALASFLGRKNEVYNTIAAGLLNCRVKNNKLFIDMCEPLNRCFPDIKYDSSINLFLAMGQSLTIKTKATPKIFTEIIDEEKIFKIISDTELELENMSPQIQLFTYKFLENIKELHLIDEEFLKILFTDIFMNVMNGKHKYKLSQIFQKLLKKAEDKNQIIKSAMEEIYKSFKEFFEHFVLDFKVGEFDNYKIIDFDNIDFYIVSELYKVGLQFNFKIPGNNEYFDKIISEKKKNNKKEEKN